MLLNATSEKKNLLSESYCSTIASYSYCAGCTQWEYPREIILTRDPAHGYAWSFAYKSTNTQRSVCFCTHYLYTFSDVS